MSKGVGVACRGRNISEDCISEKVAFYRRSQALSVSTNPTTGDPSIVPTSAPVLTRELSVAATREKYDGRAEDFVRCDQPTRHAAILYYAQQFRHLPPLAGVARQPYFRDVTADSKLII